MAKTIDKTHLLSSPNKKYLGHCDLPEGRDLILTIKSGGKETVKDPITKKSEELKIFHFEENYKPWIVNQTNSKAVMKSTGKNYMEDCAGMKIKLSVAKTIGRDGEETDCIRVKKMSEEDLVTGNISEEQIHQLNELMKRVGQDEKKFCQALRISQLSEVPVGKFEQVMKQLRGKIPA